MTLTRHLNPSTHWGNSRKRKKIKKVTNHKRRTATGKIEYYHFFLKDTNLILHLFYVRHILFSGEWFVVKVSNTDFVSSG